MKNKNFKKQIYPFLVFILFSTLGILFFQGINTRSFHSYLTEYRNFFYLIIQKEAGYISSNFLTNAEIYNIFIANQNDEIQSAIQKIQDSNPYIEDIQIIEENPPFLRQKFIITSDSNNLYISLKIYDLNKLHMISDKYIRIEYNERELLSKLQNYDRIVFSDLESAHYFIYDMDVISTEPMNSILTLSLSILFGLLCSLAYYAISYQLEYYFYEPRGLEKIIFLFEKTEEYSANHSRNVAEISYYLGKKYGLKRKKLKDIKVAAYLHDIGKISIPVEILNKNGPLSKDEFGVVKKHVVFSAEIIENFEELKHLKEIILCHHEKMDGSGYPNGLVREEIPLESRIIAVADVFEALVGQRPYRDPLNMDEALLIMRNMSLDEVIYGLLIEFRFEVNSLISYQKARLERII